MENNEAILNIPPDKYVEHIRNLHAATQLLHDGAIHININKLREAIRHYEQIIEILLRID
jgi:hypothetical protein